jgi:hypothetical protein
MKKIILFISLIFSLNACSYLDVVPDNVATIDNAFTMRSMAERYLFTCYSYLPQHAGPYQGNPALTAGDEIWFYSFIFANANPTSFRIALGEQNITDPYINFWDGRQYGEPLFQAIRDCNIFLENIEGVPDMTTAEKQRWVAEVKFLKAYYHFYLFRCYGPIPLIRENLPISSTPEEVRVTRRPVDECVAYIAELLDEAAIDLPDIIVYELEELGRATKSMAKAIKAQLLITAASPLFNGNPDYVSIKNHDGEPLFNPQFDPQKWVFAAEASKEAVDEAHDAGHSLYYFNPALIVHPISEATRIELNIRNSVTERWNQEIIWGNPNSRALQIQQRSQPRLFPEAAHQSATDSRYAATMKMAELFHSKNGVPITEDKEYDYANRFGLRLATDEDRLYIREGKETAILNFDREPRFYASLGFDTGRWYGQGKYEDTDNYYIEAKGQEVAGIAAYKFSVTGYWPKKLVNYLNVASANGYSVQQYPWPVIRLASLYLFYAEALNETDAPEDEVLYWVDQVRQRAGLNPVKQSWTNFSNQPSKPATKTGRRDIIHTERLIEMAFEGHRFWDLKRWKKAEEEFNKPIIGWNIEGTTAQDYYRTRTILNQKFAKRDYFWPIREQSLLENNALVQNYGW